MIGRLLFALSLLIAGVASSRAEADLQTEVARAEAVFIAVYDPYAHPSVKVEHVFYKGVPPFGDIAIFQGVNTMLDRIRSSAPPPAHGGRNVVFARTAKGDFLSGSRPLAFANAYPISLERFRVGGREYTLAELADLLGSKGEG